MRAAQFDTFQRSKHNRPIILAKFRSGTAIMSDRLIEVVKKYPILYDTRGKESRNKGKKDEMWKKVAAELRLKSGPTAKAKWRNIRDSYVKYLKALRSQRDDVKKYVNWPWAYHMEFLKQHLDIPEKPPKTEQHDISETDDLDDHHGYADYIEVPLPLAQNEDYPRAGLDDPIGGASKKFIGENNFDAEDLLFLSYAQTLKTFSKRRQAEIKKQVCLLMNKAELEHIVEEEEKTNTTNARIN